MKKTIRHLIVVVCLCLASQPLFAQTDSAAHKRFEKTLLPIILYDPFTGLGYGGLCNMNFLLGDKATTRYSNSQVVAMYTTKEQLVVQANHQIFTNHEKYMWQGRLAFLNWPEYTYALGANTPKEAPTKELVHYKALDLEQRVLRKIGKHKVFLGLQYRFLTSWDVHTNSNGIPSFFNEKAVGNKGFIVSGLGPQFIFDSRDNVQNASSGKYLELSVAPSFKALGATQDWVNLRMDYRLYHQMGQSKKSIWANRFFAEQALGDVPYMLTPMPGRYFTTRGYVQGRYRGNLFLTAETEYRAPLWKWIGYVVFANAHTLSEPDNSIQYVNPAIGGGLRLMLNKAHKTNLRIDYAQGMNGNSGLYFHITEVF